MELHFDIDVSTALNRASISSLDLLTSKKDYPISYLYRAKGNPNMIGYLDKKRVDELKKLKGVKKLDSIFGFNYNDPKLHKLAIMAKAGRVIKKLIPDIDAKKLTNFVSHFTITTGEFRIWKNVTRAYDSHINSCMQHQDMSFYRKNDINVLVLVTNKKVVGRAIYFPEIYFSKLKKTLPLISRVYTIDGKDNCQFEKYALKHDCVLALSDTRFLFQGNEFECNIEFKLKDMNIDFWPYMDVLCYITEECTLNNHCNGCAMESTEGCNPFENDEGEWSEYYDDYVPYDCAVYSHHVESMIHIDNAVRVNGEWYPEDSDAISNCDSCNETGLSRNMIQLYDGDYLCDDCIIELDAGEHEGEYAGKHDRDVVETYNGETCLISDCVKLDTGEYALSDDEELDEDLAKEGVYSIETKTN